MAIQPVGYIKLHRELASKPIWFKSTSEQKVILITLLMMANYKPNQWEWNCQKFDIKPGQFVTSLNSIVEECGGGISIQNVRSALVRFEKLDFLTNESTKQGRFITIRNWDLYQSDDVSPTKQPTKTQQSTNKELTTKEERKKVRKKELKDIEDFAQISYSENPILNQTILNFVEHRKTIKAPLSDHALKLLLTSLSKLSSNEVTQVDILNQSIMNGWKGVFPLKGDVKNSASVSKSKNQFHIQEKSKSQYSDKELNEILRKKTR